MAKGRFIIVVLLAGVLFVVGGLYIKQGVRLIGEADVYAAQIEKQKKYFDLGFNSAREWKQDYLASAYIRLAGGSLMLVTGLYLLFRKKPGQQDRGED